MIRRISALQPTETDELADILVAVVEQGASVGYLPPLDREVAVGYWDGVVGQWNVILLVAEIDGQIAGTAQLELATKNNGNHRAEVNKVLVHPAYQRRGLGRAMMIEIERLARIEGRTLLHLDTREGDRSNDLYRAMGYVEAGRIPQWARSATGELAGTVLYYKLLS